MNSSRMFERIQKLLDRIESRIALWQIAVGGSALSAGGLSAWVASITQWLDTYGPIAWWFAGLLGALVTVLLILVLAWIRYAWIKASATRKWKDQVDDFNPLDPDFHRKRLKLSDLAHPVTKSIDGKSFVDCELMGPANLFMQGPGIFIGVSMMDCDIVVLRNVPKMRIHNVIAVRNTNITNGSIWNCTIYIPPGMVPTFQKMGAEFLTAIEGQQTDNQSRQDTEQKTRP